MIRFLIFTCILLSAALPVQAKDDLKLNTAYQVIYAESLLRSADITLVGLENLFSKSDIERIDDLIVHNSLNRLVDRVPGMRALFATDVSGKLQHDSYRYPTRNLNLKERSYISEALKLKANDLYIGRTIKNPFFGFDSLPLSRPIFTPSGHLKGIAVAIMTPDHLIERAKVCKTCMLSIFHQNGDRITSFPANANLHANIKQVIKDFPEDHVFNATLNELPSRSIWVRSPQYKLIFLYSHLQQSP